MIKDDDVLSLYIKDISKIKMVDSGAQTELAIKAAQGDKKAKEELVTANLRFVVSVAGKYKNRGLDMADLISEGNIGLMTAIEHFDAARGYHFISYAVWWIKQAILKAICEKSRAIRLPLNRVNELTKIERTRKMLAGRKTETQEIVEIARILNMDEMHVREMLNISREMVSLDSEIVISGKDSTSLGNFLEDTRYSSPDEYAVRSVMHNDIDNVLNTLSPKEAKILRLRYGMNGNKPMSLKEVGDMCNLTKERIRQIEKRAITRMQHPKRKNRLETYVA